MPERLEAAELRALQLRGSPSGLTPQQRQSRRFNDSIAAKISATDILQICERNEA